MSKIEQFVVVVVVATVVVVVDDDDDDDDDYDDTADIHHEYDFDTPYHHSALQKHLTLQSWSLPSIYLCRQQNRASTLLGRFKNVPFGATWPI